MSLLDGSYDCRVRTWNRRSNASRLARTAKLSGRLLRWSRPVCASVLALSIAGIGGAVSSASVPPDSHGNLHANEVGDSQVITRDVTYASNSGPHAMTVYRSAKTPAAGAPAIVMVHGGAWIGGSRDLLDSQARAAAERGFVAFSIDYETGAALSPRQLDDVIGAFSSVRSRADEFGIDPNRIGGLGTSAGAHLLMLASTVGRVPMSAVVGWSGPYDITGQDDLKDRLVSAGASVLVVGCLPIDGTWSTGSVSIDATVLIDATVSIDTGCNQRGADASPLLRVTASGPPTLLFNSMDELIPVNQMYRFADQLRQHGAQVETVEVPGSRHAVAYSEEALSPTLDFFGEHV